VSANDKLVGLQHFPFFSPRRTQRTQSRRRDAEAGAGEVPTAALSLFEVSDHFIRQLIQLQTWRGSKMEPSRWWIA